MRSALRPRQFTNSALWMGFYIPGRFQFSYGRFRESNCSDLNFFTCRSRHRNRGIGAWRGWKGCQSTFPQGSREAGSSARRFINDPNVLSTDEPAVVLDFSLPAGPLRAPYRWYLHHVLPHFAGWLTGQKDAYEYLGGSIEQFPSGTAMTALLESCGLGETNAAPMTFGVVTIYEGRRARE